MAYNVASDYITNEVLDWLTGVADPPAVSSGRYLALATTKPTDAGSFTELSGNNYSRTTLASKFPAATGATVTNNATITTAAASGGDWAEVFYWVIMDAATGGNMIAWGQIGGSSSVRTITSGNTMSFTSGQISLRLN